MANTITLRKAYSTMLDEVYKLASLTAVLDGPNELVVENVYACNITRYVPDLLTVILLSLAE